MNSHRKAAGLFVLLSAMLLGSCTDPQRDAEIEALGPEDPGVPPGPDHRPGQPCVHCHTKGGPASDHPFAIAGTIYETSGAGSKGADKIFVQFVDSVGGAPNVIPQTGPSGNFWIRTEDWPDLAFPVRVGLYQDINGAPVAVMKSLMNREGSCNFCHRPNIANPTPQELDQSRSSAGQIFLKAGGT